MVVRSARVLPKVLFSLLVAACGRVEPPPPPAEEDETEERDTRPRRAATEVVFDPTNPPPGWVQCHRNHCHHQNGRVASYAQVMEEIGATRMVGGEAPRAAPPAPPDLLVTPPDAERTQSGVLTRVLRRGTGTRRPGPTSTVTVHYTGWTTDGRSFDSSIPRGRPAQLPLNRVIPGWTEGLQLMVEGEERRMWIPEELAYRGQPGRPQGMLVFDVELISIRD